MRANDWQSYALMCVARHVYEFLPLLQHAEKPFSMYFAMRAIVRYMGFRPFSRKMSHNSCEPAAGAAYRGGEHLTNG